MAKDHYVPAALIGRFSTETTLLARSRKIYVARATKVFLARAADVGFVRDLYTLDPTGPAAPDVDRIVSGYEKELPVALDLLEQSRRVPLKVWLRTLVPWVTSVFVRGTDFVPRFAERLISRGLGAELNTPDSANLARALEFQRLLAPVMAARWMVLHRTKGEPFTINDRGLTRMGHPLTGELGWALPLSHSSVLGILPKVTRTVAHYRSGSWWANVDHGPVPGPSGSSGLNEAVAQAAAEFVVAPELAVAERLQSWVGASLIPGREIMELWPFDSWTVRHHEYEWHRLVGATFEDPKPGDLGDLQELTFAGLDEDWSPIIYVGNVREMPTGLTRVGSEIRLAMTTLTNYEDFVLGPGDEDYSVMTDRAQAARTASPQLGWYFMPLSTSSASDGLT